MEITSLLNLRFELFLLILTRVSGIFSTAPFFGSRNIPATVRIGAAVFVSLLILPLIVNSPVQIPTHILAYAVALVGELIVGLIIGYVSSFIFSAVQMAGELIDLQIGFGVVNVIDPQAGGQVPLIGSFKYVIALLIFLMINGHHFLLAALVKSYTLVPLFGFKFSNLLVDTMLNFFVAMFVVAFKIALPTVGALFLTDIALGILARTVPQMNVFMVGLPGKIFAGVLTLILVLPLYLVIIEILFNGMYSDVLRLLQSMHQ